MENPVNEEDTPPGEAPVMNVTCSGGITLPSLSVMFGPKPVPPAFLRKETPDGE